MGFLKSVVKAVAAPFNPKTYMSLGKNLGKDFSGSSQQKDANAMAMQAWNLANDYNSPKAQVERLVEAGLNPYLVNLSGNTAGVPGLTGGNVLTDTQSLFSGLSNVMGVLQGQANLQQTRAQTQASTAAAGASAAQANYVQAQQTGQELKNDFYERSMIADLDYKKAQTELARQQARKTAAEGDIAQGEANIFGAAGGAKGAQAGAKAGSGLLKATGQFIRGVMRK